jgi:hypothetical protein
MFKRQPHDCSSWLARPSRFSLGTVLFLLITFGVVSCGSDDGGTPTPTSTLRFAQASYTPNEGVGALTVSVTRTGSAGAVSVNYNSSDGSALAGSDYDAKWHAQLGRR